MISSDLKNRISEINIENFIWVIYLLIILLSFYSNYFEKKYFLNKNTYDKDRYRKIVVIIFSILIVVYIYFLQDSFKSVLELKESDSKEKKELVLLSFLGSLLIAISGFIYLYIAMVDENLDVEIAFN